MMGTTSVTVVEGSFRGRIIPLVSAYKPSGRIYAKGCLCKRVLATLHSNTWSYVEDLVCRCAHMYI